MIVYSQPYDPMLPISKDRLHCHFLFQSNLMFPIYFHVSNKQCYNLHIALESLFPIYEFCFQPKFIVSTVLFFVSYLIIMSIINLRITETNISEM